MLENNLDPAQLSRIELLQLAQTLHVSDADVMTRAELRAAIEKARKPQPRPPAQPVTWVSVARRLLASIVEQGLNLPDAAALIRGDTKLSTPPRAPPPVATVTLARIYAAQGHLARAIGTLDEVLASDPDHDLARELRGQLSVRLAEEAERGVSPTSAGSDSETPPAQAAAGPAGEPAAEPAGVSVASSVAEAPGAAEPAPPAESATPAAPVATEGGATAELTPSPESAPPSELAPPQSPQLLVIETDSPTAYIYWELSKAKTNGSSTLGQYWICVVTHTPTSTGSERQERRFPVHHAHGALRLEGVPRQAVVRAALTRGDAANAPPLVVAGSVRTRQGLSPDAVEARFVPHPKANPLLIASRAVTQLENASAVSW